MSNPTITAEDLSDTLSDVWAWLTKPHDRAPQAHVVLERLVDELSAYFSNVDPSFDVTLFKGDCRPRRETPIIIRY